MLIVIIVGGGIALAGLAVVVGRLEGFSQRGAWNRIAAARRALAERDRLLDEREEALAEEGRELWAWEGQLIAASERHGCAVCELRRRRNQRPGS